MPPSPRTVREFIGRSMHEIWKKRFIRKYVGFIYRYGAYKRETTLRPPPPSLPSRFLLLRSRLVRIRREYLFLLQPSTTPLPESTDFLSPLPIDFDAVPIFPEINKSEKFHSFSSYFRDLVFLIYGEHISSYEVYEQKERIFSTHIKYIFHFPSRYRILYYDKIFLIIVQT